MENRQDPVIIPALGLNKVSHFWRDGKKFRKYFILVRAFIHLTERLVQWTGSLCIHGLTPLHLLLINSVTTIAILLFSPIEQKQFLTFLHLKCNLCQLFTISQFIDTYSSQK